MVKRIFLWQDPGHLIVHKRIILAHKFLCVPVKFNEQNFSFNFEQSLPSPFEAMLNSSKYLHYLQICVCVRRIGAIKFCQYSIRSPRLTQISEIRLCNSGISCFEDRLFYPISIWSKISEGRRRPFQQQTTSSNFKLALKYHILYKNSSS